MNPYVASMANVSRSIAASELISGFFVAVWTPKAKSSVKDYNVHDIGI